MWTQDKVDYNGRFYKLEGAFVQPKPIQNPLPIWLTGDPPKDKPHIAERNLRRVARMGDGWMTTVNPPELLAERKKTIIGYAKEYGKDLTNFAYCRYGGVNIGDDHEAAYLEAKAFLDEYYYPTNF